MFSKNHRQDFLVQRFMEVMKGEVWMKGGMGGERKFLKVGLEWALWAGRTILPSETKHLHFSSSSLCHGPPFICSSPTLAFANHLLVKYWWHVFDGKPPGAPLVTCLDSGSVVREHEFLWGGLSKWVVEVNLHQKIVKQWGQRPYFQEKTRSLLQAVFWEQLYASFPPWPFVIEQREREWDLGKSIHSFIYSFAFNLMFFHSINMY